MYKRSSTTASSATVTDSSSRSRKRRKKNDERENGSGIFIEYEDDDMTQTVTTRYTVGVDGVRHICGIGSDAPAPKRSHWVRKIRVSLHMQLLPRIWTRHGYSRDDVKQMLSDPPAQVLYLLALMMGPLGISPSHSAARISYSGPMCMTYSSKAIVSRKILEFACSNIVLSKNSVLDRVRVMDVPALPVHQVSQRLFADILTEIPHGLQYSGKERNHWNKSYEICGKQMVPFGRNMYAIYMVRIISHEDYDRSARTIDSPATTPVLATVGGKHYYATIEEACYLLPTNWQA